MSNIGIKNITKMKEQIKNISDNILIILSEGKPLYDLHKRFDELLTNLNNNFSGLDSKKIELINIIFRYPKKKILFNFRDDDKDSYSKDVIIGCNEGGLGISLGEHYNLRNIDDYWERQKFARLFKNEDFRKLMLEKTKDEHKAIMPKLMTKEKQNYTKIITIKDEILIEICDSTIIFQHINKDGDKNNIGLLNEDNVREFVKEYREGYLKEMSKYDFQFDFNSLLNFAYLLKFKDEIIKVLSDEIISYEKMYADLKAQNEEIDNLLKPYKALQKI